MDSARTRRSSAPPAPPASTVVIAGTTVAIAMAAQFIVGSDIFNGIAAGTIAVVACAVVGSVTVLPAVLELLGPTHRPRPDPVPAAPARRRRVALLAGRRRPRPASPGGFAAPRRRLAGRAGRARPRHARRQARLERALRRRPVGAGDADHHGVPRPVLAGDRGRRPDRTWAGRLCAAPSTAWRALAAAEGIAHRPFTLDVGVPGRRVRALAAADRPRRQRRQPPGNHRCCART